LKLKPTTFDHALELVERVEGFIDGVKALVDGRSEHVPSLNMELPKSGLPEGTSNAILKKVPGDDEKFQVVYRQVCE